MFCRFLQYQANRLTYSVSYLHILSLCSITYDAVKCDHYYYYCYYS